MKTLKMLSFVSCLILSGSVSSNHPDNISEEARSLIGRVVSVVSGDTVELLLPGGEVVQIKLAGAKAPGVDNPFAKASQRWLTAQLLNQLVSAECVMDRLIQKIEKTYRCVLFPDDRDINHVSLYFGYNQYEKSEVKLYNELLYRAAQDHAQKNKIGVWNQLTGNK